MNNVYSTEQFYLAITAICKGFPIEKIYINPQSGQAEFHFIEDAPFREFLESYRKRKVFVEAQSHFEAYKSLKNTLNEMKRNY